MIVDQFEHPIPAADWSYACIEYVTRLADPRNCATLTLYACLAYIILAAKPWAVALEWTGKLPLQVSSTLLVVSLVASFFRVFLFLSKLGTPTCMCILQPEHQVLANRWRLAVVIGLVVGPFFPAANVLFYVGTFIGERLLYFPSGGLCEHTRLRGCYVI